MPAPAWAGTWFSLVDGSTRPAGCRCSVQQVAGSAEQGRGEEIKLGKNVGAVAVNLCHDEQAVGHRHGEGGQLTETGTVELGEGLGVRAADSPQRFLTHGEKHPSCREFFGAV